MNTDTTDKNALRARAQDAAKRFCTARRPVVIEFAGVPKAGKTTVLTHVHTFLKRCGFRVETVVERASVCPIKDKKHFNFNVWTACTTLAQILEKTQAPPRADDPDVLLLDRGLFDAVNWFAVMEHIGRINTAEREIVDRFLLMEDWSQRITGVVVMTTSPAEALKREQGYLPVPNATGRSIMNPEVLPNVLATVKATTERLKEHFRVFEIDTSDHDPGRTIEHVASFAVTLIEEHLDEQILFLNAGALESRFGSDVWVGTDEAHRLIELFSSDGAFKSRNTVEADQTAVQALPVVVVRNQSGHVLQLKRRERRRDNPLHDKIVIWAGGHVRVEDRDNGASIIQCAKRELKEELRLSVDEQDLTILGAVWTRASDRTRRHLALVYEWRAPTDDVAVALSAAEFYERRGTSLSGSFVKAQDLATNIDDGLVSEPWSVEIARNLLPEVSRHLARPTML